MEENERDLPAGPAAEPVTPAEDPDSPATVEVSEVEAAPAPEELVIAEDPDGPVTVDQPNTTQATEEPTETSEPVVTEDPDAPVTVDQPYTTQTADGEQSENEIAIEADSEPEAASTESSPELPRMETTLPEEAILPEQLLIGTDTPADQAESNEARLLALLEAVVYVTDEPLSLEQIAKALGESQHAVKDLLDKLVEEFNKPNHGLTVREVAGGYKMATKPEHHEAVRNFVKNLNPPLKLSLAALETLAVIAYKQPITAPEIMEIRGVQGAGVLKTLIDRKLITTAGRKNVVGKPILYKTTREFLVQFGLRDLNELPTLKEFEDLRRMAFTDDAAPADSIGPEDTEQASEPVQPEEPQSE